MTPAPTRPHQLMIARSVDPILDEVIDDLCWRSGAWGIEEREDHRMATFPDEATATWTAERIDVLTGGTDGPVAVPVDETDWLDAWRPHAQVVRVGAITVRPPWVPESPGDRSAVELLIDPGHAFGSGSHASTQLALAALQHAPGVAPMARVLDIGSGSGVLGVAALALGAGSVVAVDTDPAARAATLDNAEAHGFGDRVQVMDGPADLVPGPFDLILANMLAPTLCELAPAIVAALGDRGRLVMAGLLTSQRQAVSAAFTRLHCGVEFVDGDWVALVWNHR